MARPRSDIEPRIVSAARERFLVDGVDGASLRGVARDAGTSIGMVYYYFPTKDDLFLAVVEEIYVGLLADMERALATDAPVRERLERLYLRVGAVTELEIKTIKLMVREVLVSSARLERLVERFARGHLPLVFSTLAEGMSTGVFDPSLHPAMPLLATVALGTLPQFIRQAAPANLPIALPARDDLARQLIDVLFGGIGKADRNADDK